MSNTERPAYWTGGHAARLRQFLADNPDFIRALKDMRPRVTDTETIEARAMSASEIKGAEHLIFDSIEGLSLEKRQRVDEKRPSVT